MRIEIRARHFTLTETLRTHVERRARFAMGRLSDRVREVTVRLEDINGPRGGVDKVAKVTVRLEHGGQLASEAMDATFPGAVDRALERAGHAVGKALGRSHRQDSESVRTGPWEAEEQPSPL
ncbi:HPF/RaiA family ribosome-associated protein [Myxococcus sp. K38C18041901]|uniref:HPF/RaiA family ribosome-associated protein n=1 Tax=Myxococcus guangdongensis TaxID=2906760 RepID=UPI0020A80941|nr:HPF/RaiA family ribosome-associated protein [Myxococcus guangdongensis]MCP3057249.1 HPF/RaiA family ribosome-associated protein [Myxococcus guangdongensis]